jgi:hypothetical protein
MSGWRDRCDAYVGMVANQLFCLRSDPCYFT